MYVQTVEYTYQFPSYKCEARERDLIALFINVVEIAELFTIDIYDIQELLA